MPSNPYQFAANMWWTTAFNKLIVQLDATFSQACVELAAQRTEQAGQLYATYKQIETQLFGSADWNATQRGISA